MADAAPDRRASDHDSGHRLVEYAHRTRRLIYALSLALAVIITTALPAEVYFNGKAVLEVRADTEARSVANRLSQFIAGDPQLWMFHDDGLQAILAGGIHDPEAGEEHDIIVRDRTGEQIFRSGAGAAGKSSIVVREQLYDGANPAGTVILIYPTRHLINDTLTALALGASLGIAFMVFIQALPLRAVNRLQSQIESDQQRLGAYATRVTLQSERLEAEIQAREAMEETVAQAQKGKAMGTLLGGIAHSINNYLVPITTLTRMVRDDLPRDADSRADLDRVIRSAEGAGSVMRDVLDFTRTRDAADNVTDLVGSVARTIALAEAATPSNITVKQFLPDAACPVRLKESNIQTLMLNLISNASDAIGQDGGQIEIEIAEHGPFGVPLDLPRDLAPGAYVRLRVADNGGGIDAENLTRIFDPFFTTKRVGEGTGLGLSVTYGLVTGVGGGIYVHSDGRTGTRFDLYLPILSGVEASAVVAETDVPISKEA